MALFRWLIAAALAALLLPAAALAQQSTPVVRGGVIVPGAAALPGGATLTVQLQDVSRADAPAATLAQQTQDVGGRRSPIPYELRYNPVQILPGGRYVVRAEIRVGSVLIYTSPSSVAVLTGGAPTTADVRVERTSNALPPTSGGGGLLAIAALLALGAALIFALRRRIKA